jgi:hypothetical protein
MREDEIEKVLAAAAPQEVPAVPDMHHRARSLGRRRRMHRTMLTAGGTGVAMVAVAGAALAFGGGRAGAPNGPVPAAAGGSDSTTRTTATPTGYRSLTAHGDAAAEADAAIRAALPPGYSGDTSQSWAAPSKFGTTLKLVEPHGNQIVLNVIVGVADGAGATAHCPADAKCTTGTTPVHGQVASWAFSEMSKGLPTSKPTGSGSTSEARYGDDGEVLSVLDPAGHYEIQVLVTGKAVPNLPTMADLKNIGLNDKVVAALLAARG